MLKELAASFQSAKSGRLRSRIVGIYALLMALNVGAWTLVLCAFWEFPGPLSLCLVAYGLGLRHAVDADHIAAIDNVTRKLMEQNKRPAAVGFFFSLGHSTVVLLMCLAVGVWDRLFAGQSELQRGRRIIGTAVSAAFLLLLAFLNLIVFVRVFRAYRTVQTGSDNNWRSRSERPRPLGSHSCGRFSISRIRVGTCFRSAFCSGSVSIRRRRCPYWESARRKPLTNCRSGRSWFFHCSSRQECA